MKKILRLSLLFAISALSVSAQTNSVELKNTSNVVISQHNSIAAAYGAIPAAITQGYIIEITSAYTGANETYPIVFGVKTGSSATNTITLRPATGVSNVNISTSGSGTSVFQLDDADYIIVDGRPGGAGTTKALTFTNTATASNSNTVQLINGACNNIIRYCNINNSTVTNAGRGLHISTSASNITGNSDNRIEFCQFTAGRYVINVNGTAANPNTRNTIYGCDIADLVFVGIWYQSGTAKLTIDSNNIHCNSATGSGPFGILFDSQTDTVVIRKNRIYDINNGTNTSAVKGISLRTTTGTNQYLLIHNNFISLPGNHGSTNVAGIEYTGGNQMISDVYYNTIRIGGTLSSGGTSGSIVSAALLRSTNNTSATSVFNFRNNISINERTGGASGVIHTISGIQSLTGTIASDYNVYNVTSGVFGVLGTTPINNFASYQGAVAPNDANSNTTAVQLVSTTDLHLTGTSIGNTSLQALPIAGITTDIDNDTRSATPYRGADEVPSVTTCTGTPAAATISGPAAAICANASVTFTATGFASGTGISYKWQASPPALNTWTDYPGATGTSLTANIPSSVDVRFITMCSGSGLADTSNVVQVTVTPLPVAGSITEVHTGLSYTFTAVGVLNATSDVWLYGDGNFGTSTAHVYATPGSYTVKHAVANACGNDTATLVITAGAAPCAGTPDPATITGPANVCESVVFNLSATGQSSGNGISYKWQFLPVGTSTYIDVPAPGTTPAITFASPFTASFRFITTCSFSGLSDTSNVILVTIDSLPDAGTITEAHTLGAYTFTATGVQKSVSQTWHYGDGNSDATGIHTYTTSGTYNVMHIAENPCGRDTAFKTISVVLGIDDVAGMAKFVTVYPNPASDHINVKADGNVVFTSLSIINSVGAVVVKEELTPANSHRLSTGNLAAGSYILLIQTADGIVNKHFSITR